MTATAAVLPAATPAPRAPTSEPRDSASAGHFDRQLDAARQDAARQDAARQKPASPADKPAGKTPTPAAGAQAKSASEAAARQKTADATAPAPSDDDTPADGETAASALAGAMLALLGPAAGSLRGQAPDGVADALAGAGKKGGKGDAAAALLAMNPAADGAAATAAATATLRAGAGILLAADDGKPAFAEKLGEVSQHAPAAALAMPTTNPNAAPATVHQLQIPTPAGNHGFAQELGQHVAWLGAQDVKQARIRLHPEDLGQLDIKVSVNHGRVDVVFNAQHPGAVTAVQQSLPQLDQMLGQHGLSLGHAEVGQHGHGQQGRGDQAATADRRGLDDVAEIHGVTATTGTVSLLDAFA